MSLPSLQEVESFIKSLIVFCHNQCMDTLLIVAVLAFIYLALGRLSKAAAKIADDLENGLK